MRMPQSVILLDHENLFKSMGIILDSRASSEWSGRPSFDATGLVTPFSKLNSAAIQTQKHV